MKGYRERIAAKKSRLNQSTAVVATAVALTSISQQAEAAIVIHDYSITDSQYDADPLNGTVSTIDLTGSPLGFRSSGALFIITAAQGSSSDQRIDDRGELSLGATIGPLSNFADITTSPASDGTSRFVGFRLLNQGVSSDETYYGWAEYIARSDNSSSLLRTAVNTTAGESITIVPEPGVPLFGAAALVMTISLRRRKGAHS